MESEQQDNNPKNTNKLSELELVELKLYDEKINSKKLQQELSKTKLELIEAHKIIHSHHLSILDSDIQKLEKEKGLYKEEISKSHLFNSLVEWDYDEEGNLIY